MADSVMIFFVEDTWDGVFDCRDETVRVDVEVLLGPRVFEVDDDFLHRRSLARRG